MRRYDCLAAIAPLVADSLVITNLANTATEWRSVRPHEANLYFVGMGMVTPYAIGLALALPSRRVLALDGDGGILFDLAALGTLAQTAPGNLCVVVFDNEGYVSTGKSASTVSLTAGFVDIEAVARAAGIARPCTVGTWKNSSRRPKPPITTQRGRTSSLPRSTGSRRSSAPP